LKFNFLNPFSAVFVAFETNAEFLLVYFASAVRFLVLLLKSFSLQILVTVSADTVVVVVPIGESLVILNF